MNKRVVLSVATFVAACVFFSSPIRADPVAVLYVATTGSDATGDGSGGAPYATISKAVSVATVGTEIRVQGGLYTENVVNATISDLAILGGYDGNWARDLAGAQTVVKAANANSPVVELKDPVTDVRLGGLVLTGGKYGVKTAHVAGMVFEQLVISNNSNYAIGYSDTAADRNLRMAIVSCLIAGNGAGNPSYAASIKEDACGWAGPWYIDVYSCTFLNNRNEEFHGNGYVTFRNNVFTRASGVPSVGVNTGNLKVWYYDNCVDGFGTTVEAAYPSAIKGASGNIYDPAAVNADGTLSDVSPCLKAGGDLSDDAVRPVLVDLYGNAWNGEYDMGCLKSAYRPYVPRDIHVATTGSDATGDGTAARPYGSIGFAIGLSKLGDRVLVQGGTYVENVVSTVDDLEVLGSFDANWERDLAGSRTVITAANANQTVLFIDQARRNHWSGIDLTGGKNGLIVYGFRGGVFAQMKVTGCSSSGIGFGDVSGDVNAANVFVDLYVADNGGTGIYHYKNNWGSGYRLYWYNCTFFNNAQGTLNSMGWHTFKNCIFFNPNAASEFTGTGNTHVTFTACCVRDALYGSTDKTIVAEPETLSVDAKLDSAGRLTQPSLCNKRGADLSADTVFAVTEDLEGNAWNGEYDMGAFKSPYPWVSGVVRLPNVYVSADGDDENDGSAEHPVATLLQGLNLTAAGGTCHVGPGGFRGNVTLERPGMTLVGAGMGLTVVTNGPITIGAHDGTVRDLSLFGRNRDGGGLIIAQQGLVTNATVACCEIAQWGRGIAACNPGELNSQHNCDSQTYRFSHLVVTNCGIYGGIYARGRITIDNCLIATNNAAGLHVYGGGFHAYNCTFADNLGIALDGPDGNAAHERVAVNCIFSGSEIAYAFDVVAERQGDVFSNCLFACEHPLYSPYYGRVPAVESMTDCVTGEDPQFRMSPLHMRYHLMRTSPACRGGVAVGAPDGLVPSVSVSLDGKTRGRFWDMGCFEDPRMGFSVLIH